MPQNNSAILGYKVERFKGFDAFAERRALKRLRLSLRLKIIAPIRGNPFHPLYPRSIFKTLKSVARRIGIKVMSYSKPS